MHQGAIVSDKLDGSLGIIYETPDGLPAIATRGSFASNQAIKGTEILRNKYPGVPVVFGYTSLFEIVYPDNRIVLNYGDTEDLFILGAIEIVTGRVFDPEYAASITRWSGPSADILGCKTLATAIYMANRENAEGMVALVTDEITHKQTIIKIKQDDYLALHKTVTGLSERALWESVNWEDDTPVADQLSRFVEKLPDEFQDWANQVALDLTSQLTKQLVEINNQYARIAAEIPNDVDDSRESRKLLAAKVLGLKNAPYMYLLWDGKSQVDISAKLWKSLKPVGSTSVWGDVDHGETSSP
jgi:RNA ligase